MKFLKDIYLHFMRSNTFEKGAALSYYTVFSFLPIAMIITSALGLIFKEDVISDELNSFLSSIVGSKGAAQFSEIITQQHLHDNTLITTIIGISMLLFAATGMFSQIYQSLNAIWGFKVKPEKSIFNYFARHFSALLILLFMGFCLLLSTAINTFLIKFSSSLPEALRNVQLYEHLISYILITLLFAIFFKFMGNALVPWKTALAAAAFTSVLFFIGKIGIGLYISHSDFKSMFGTASFLAILMIWVYYSSQILFFGASFAYVFGQRTGYDIKPTSQAVRIVQKELR